MAYLPPEERIKIDQMKIGDCGRISNDAQLTYALLKVVRQYIYEGGCSAPSEAVGALENAKSELYRVVINPGNAQRQFDFEN